MMLPSFLKAAVAASLTAALCTPAPAQFRSDDDQRSRQTLRSILDHDTPRLVVVMSFDQLRADYLTRFSDQFLPASGPAGKPGGFRYLMEKGAVFANTHYTHVPTHTGPGHATILTGASPSVSGIIGNDWPTSTGKRLNCVGDESVKTVGGPERATKIGSSSPRNLEVETVGDALRLSNNRQSKVVGIGIKDRGAILMTGHNPTAAVWFDAGIGRFVTSSWYTTGTLPRFAARVNEERLADRWLGSSWDYLLPAEAYRRSSPPGVEGQNDGRGLGNVFPKQLPSEPSQDYYNRMIFTPYGNELIAEVGRAAVEEELLGTDAYTDFLCMSFSTTDLIGHTWGPNSAEAHDAVLRADRTLSDFFAFLDFTVPGGLDQCLIVLTGDHGATPLVEWVTSTMNFPAARIQYDTLQKAAEEALAAVFPDKQTTGLIEFSDPYVFFRKALFAERGVDPVIAAEVIADRLRNHYGVYETYTREQIMKGLLPRTEQAQMAVNGYYESRSGDVLVLCDPFFYASRGYMGTTHGTGWNYDTHVPLVITGKNIKPGLYTDRTDVRDIAPTLATMLGITPPNGSQGRILGEIFR